MSVIKSLTPGTHTIVFKEMPGYENLTCNVTVADGAVQCDSVNGVSGYCGRTISPGVTVESPTVLRAYLNEGAAIPEPGEQMCNYVSGKGGASKVDNDMFLATMYAILGSPDVAKHGYKLTFTPTNDEFLAVMYLTLARINPAAKNAITAKLKAKCGW